jgi:hypothetical protein
MIYYYYYYYSFHILFDVLILPMALQKIRTSKVAFVKKHFDVLILPMALRMITTLKVVFWLSTFWSTKKTISTFWNYWPVDVLIVDVPTPCKRKYICCRPFFIWASCDLECHSFVYNNKCYAMNDTVLTTTSRNM